MLWVITRSAPTIASTDIDLTTLQKQLGMFVTIPVAHPDRKSDGIFSDAQGLELVENQKESLVGRKALADRTKGA